MNVLDARVCYRALQTRDARFDGRLYVGVTSTGIYCRPICPARTPKPENCRFFTTAAAAAREGFRPCRRCRPESTPDLASWRGTSNTVSRALALIARGDLDGDAEGVDALAGRLGLGARQLRRLFTQHLGASPIAVAQTRRVLFARELIEATGMSMADVALASGFGSVRRFNEIFHQVFRCAPGGLRQPVQASFSAGPHADGGVTLRVRYKPPYDWPGMLAHLAARAVDGVERVEGRCYRRSVSIGGETGTVEITDDAPRHSLLVRVRSPSVRALPAIVGRVTRQFDVGADIAAIGRHLSRDPLLAPLVDARPGLRTPGAWDGFELAVRAILGQQVSVGAARRLAGRLVALCGEAVPPRPHGLPGLSHVFPSPGQVAAADLKALGMPAARRDALRAVAEAAVADGGLFDAHADVDTAVARLRSIRGIGDWTAHYVALRALGDTDALPVSDTALLRAVARMGAQPTPAALLQHAESWRPWRAYAAQHLWAADAAAAGRVNSRRSNRDG